MKKVLILTSSYRKNGNSNRLALSLKEGAESAGHVVEKVDLSERKISFCRGCMVCQKLFRCVIDDDANEIAEKMKSADVLVFATPVYYYSVSGLLKTMLDRANPLFPSDYRFREVYLLASAADADDVAVEGTQKAVQGWVDCFEEARFVDTVFAGGVENVGDIEGHEALRRAYEMGKGL